MNEVRFPVMSKEGAEASGVIATWYADDGQAVEAGQLLADVQMDKVDAEIVAESSGTLRIVVGEDVEVAQGALIATID